MRMHSHPVGLDLWFLVGPFIYFHSLCERTAKALARLRRCAGSPEPSLVAHVISIIIAWAGLFRGFLIHIVVYCNTTGSRPDWIWIVWRSTSKIRITYNKFRKFKTWLVHKNQKCILYFNEVLSGCIRDSNLSTTHRLFWGLLIRYRRHLPFLWWH